MPRTAAHPFGTDEKAPLPRFRGIDTGQDTSERDRQVAAYLEAIRGTSLEKLHTVSLAEHDAAAEIGRVVEGFNTEVVAKAGQRLANARILYGVAAALSKAIDGALHQHCLSFHALAAYEAAVKSRAA